MNDTALREALHDVASAGVGPDVDARVARLAYEARTGERRFAGRVPRQAWTVGTLGVAAVAVVALVVGLYAMTRPPEVVPASGPGSLPDQIFPTRQHILTMEQAPVGRVSMVYAGPLVGGVTSWVAVGADTDEYRFIAPFSVDLAQTAVDVAPDGGEVAISHAGATPDSLRVQLLDAGTGDSRWIVLPDDGKGGWVETLTWSPDGSRLAVLANVVNGDDPDGSSGRSWYFMVDVASGEVTRLPEEAVLAGDPAGWTLDGRLAVADQRGVSTVRVSAVDALGVELMAAVRAVPDGLSRYSLSPDGRLLAGLVDPTPSASGDGSVWDLAVFDVSTGEQVLSSALSSYTEDETTVVGWRDASTPVLSAARPGKDGPGVLVAYDVPAGSHEVMTRAGVEGVPRYYLTSRVAAEILSSGQVRDAQPPDQPWSDIRTLWPTVRDWAGDNVASVVLVVLLTSVVGAAFVTGRTRRRRRPSQGEG